MFFGSEVPVVRLAGVGLRLGLILVLGALCTAGATSSGQGEPVWRLSTMKSLVLEPRGCGGVGFEFHSSSLFRVTLRNATEVPTECDISMNAQTLVKGDCIERNWRQGTCNVPGELGIQGPEDICPHLSSIGMTNAFKHTGVACFNGTNYIVVGSNCQQGITVDVKVETADGTYLPWISQDACHILNTEEVSVVGMVMFIIILALIISSCVACCCLCPCCPCYWKKGHDERMRLLHMGPNHVAPAQTQSLLVGDGHSTFQHSKVHHSKVQHETYGRLRDPEMYDYHDEV